MFTIKNNSGHEILMFRHFNRNIRFKHNKHKCWKSKTLFPYMLLVKTRTKSKKNIWNKIIC